MQCAKHTKTLCNVCGIFGDFSLFSLLKHCAMCDTIKTVQEEHKTKSQREINEMTATVETTRVWLNTWGNYNEGSIGYGWMTPDEARNFIEEDSERDGGEWFIADIDNYLDVDFGSLDYANVETVIDTIETLEAMDEGELVEVIALMEYLGTTDIEEVLDKMDSYTFYSDIDSYHDCCDELLEFGNNEILERYFDYDAYHRDCDFDVYKASNGVCIQ